MQVMSYCCKNLTANELLKQDTYTQKADAQSKVFRQYRIFRGYNLKVRGGGGGSEPGHPMSPRDSTHAMNSISTQKPHDILGRSKLKIFFNLHLHVISMF